MDDSELLGSLIFPTRKPGQTATGGRKAVANHNGRILERLRGVAAQGMTLADRYNPSNPNKYWANDNDPGQD